MDLARLHPTWVRREVFEGHQVLTSGTPQSIDLRRTCETTLASLGLRKDIQAQGQSPASSAFRTSTTTDATTCAKRRSRPACEEFLKQSLKDDATL